MLKKFKNSLVVLFLLGAIVLPLSQPKSFISSNLNNNTTTIQRVPDNRHDIN